MEDIRCLTDEEAEVYEKLLNAEAEETGVKLFCTKVKFGSVKGLRNENY